MSENASVQVINEDKQFQRTDIQNYFKQVIKHDLSINYHVISVFGSQSTGKSTLLNRLFHTNFDVMNETQRQQTTKGIWLGYSPKIEANDQQGEQENILVMDVEGSDGRERGEDQDFERKAALFALATSEILIVNIWEHQVGLYQGANMALLKTVFEVNLSLFGDKDHKVLLLFVIRDHIGSTPLENLSNTLTQDLNKMWDSISKPNNVKADIKLSDYFDLEFTALAHKVLQPVEFDQDIRDLGDRFINTTNENHLFKKDYKQNLPIDGWTLYAENCWEQIQSNKDLDLPTQQILVSRFRCDEIVKESIETFELKSSEVLKDLDLKQVEGSTLASHFKLLRDLAFNSYDSQASHYNEAVYKSKRLGIVNHVNLFLQKIFSDYLKEQKKLSLETFNETFTDKSSKSLTFLEKSINARNSAINGFKNNLDPFIEQVDQELFDYTNDLEELSSELDVELSKARENEINSLVTKTLKKVTPMIRAQTLEFLSDPNEELWDNILASFRSILDASLAKYQVSQDIYDFRLGTSEEENFEIATKIKQAVWISFDQFIHDYLNDDNVISILRRHFEDKFSYDSNNVPRIWKNEVDITQAYNYATEQALSILPVISLAKLSNDSEIIPDVSILEDEDDDENDPHRFSHILSATQQLKIKKQFLKQAEISYRDANRSIITNVAKIPPFIYVLLLVLGWNEFMAILRNPLYLVLTILLGTGFFFVHSLNLWGPLETATNVLIKQAKDYLASILLDNHQTSAPIAAPSVKVESYELDELPEKREE